MSCAGEYPEETEGSRIAAEVRKEVSALNASRFLFDDSRIVHVLQVSEHGVIEHIVTEAFLNKKAYDFHRKMLECLKNNLKPRVCILGYMDFLWLKAYCSDYLRGGITPMPDPPMPEGFPEHFLFRNIICVRAVENETGYTFA